jgi:hypothetical protein
VLQTLFPRFCSKREGLVPSVDGHRREFGKARDFFPGLFWQVVGARSVHSTQTKCDGARGQRTSHAGQCKRAVREPNRSQQETSAQTKCSGPLISSTNRIELVRAWRSFLEDFTDFSRLVAGGCAARFRQYRFRPPSIGATVGFCGALFATAKRADQGF